MDGLPKPVSRELWLRAQLPGIRGHHAQSLARDLRSRPEKLAPGQPADPPLQLQHAERGHDLTGGQSGVGDQLVDAAGLAVALAQ
jgi:hypothetical protein